MLFLGKTCMCRRRHHRLTSYLLLVVGLAWRRLYLHTARERPRPKAQEYLGKKAACGEDNAVHQVRQLWSLHDSEFLPVSWMKAWVPVDRHLCAFQRQGQPITFHSNRYRAFPFGEYIPCTTDAEQKPRSLYKDWTLLLLLFIQHLGIFSISNGMDLRLD
jgi:hypothetical protein